MDFIEAKFCPSSHSGNGRSIFNPFDRLPINGWKSFLYSIKVSWKRRGTFYSGPFYSARQWTASCIIDSIDVVRLSSFLHFFFILSAAYTATSRAGLGAQKEQTVRRRGNGALGKEVNAGSLPPGDGSRINKRLANWRLSAHLIGSIRHVLLLSSAPSGAIEGQVSHLLGISIYLQLELKWNLYYFFFLLL